MKKKAEAELRGIVAIHRASPFRQPAAAVARFPAHGEGGATGGGGHLQRPRQHAHPPAHPPLAPAIGETVLPQHQADVPGRLSSERRGSRAGPGPPGRPGRAPPGAAPARRPRFQPEPRRLGVAGQALRPQRGEPHLPVQPRHVRAEEAGRARGVAGLVAERERPPGLPVQRCPRSRSPAASSSSSGRGRSELLTQERRRKPRETQQRVVRVPAPVAGVEAVEERGDREQGEKRRRRQAAAGGARGAAPACPVPRRRGSVPAGPRASPGRRAAARTARPRAG